MNKLFTRLSSLLFATLVIVACGGDDDPEIEPTPTPTPTGTVTFTKPEVTDITANSAVVKAVATPSKGLNVTARGFCYSTSSTPTVADKTVTTALNDMLVTLGGLESATTYYVKGYAETAAGTFYSDATQFTTEEAPAASLDDYVAPTYADDYRSISAWAQRSRWNLANVHDPTVMLADDGYYYMYQTDASYGNAHTAGGHFHGRRSKDLVNWEYLGGTMSAAPSWLKDTLNNSRARFGLPAIASPQYGYWAPCARKVRNGLYRMYYCIVVDNFIKTGKSNTAANFDKSWTERAFIGVMETSDPASNKWQDKGFVLSSMSDKGTNWARSNYSTDWNGYFRYNAIDPTYIITPEGQHWLIFGSWHSGFAALQMDAETGKPINKLPEFCTTLSELNKVMKRVYTRDANSRWQGSEAPEVVYHDGYYYLFMAYDGLDVPYNTRVVRSQNIDGPYYSMSGTNVTSNGGDALPIMTHPYKFSGNGWVGISHCAVFDDGKGNWYYASQGRFPTTAGGNAPNAVMLGHVRRILWTPSGWPVVLPERYGAVPTVAISESELVGTWSHITLAYDYAKQNTAVSITLKEDHTVSGAPFNNQKWSFDAQTNVLTVGSTSLVVARECDWEASPRHATIVYAGIPTGGKTTYWGKKSN